METPFLSLFLPVAVTYPFQLTSGVDEGTHIPQISLCLCAPPRSY